MKSSRKSESAGESLIPHHRTGLESAEKTRRKRLLGALALSLAIHFVFAGGIALKPSSRPALKDQTVEMITPEELESWLSRKQIETSRQIVDSDEKPINDLVDPNAKYLSRHNQKVLRETKAAQNGEFRNSGGAGPKGSASLAQSSSQSHAQMQSQTTPKPSIQPSAETSATNETSATAHGEVETFANGDLAVGLPKPSRKLLKFSKPSKDVSHLTPDFRTLPQFEKSEALGERSASGNGNGQQVSSTDDHIKDVKTGMQTLLSTREFVYFSYYNRIKEKLRQHWQPKIRERFTRIIKSGRQIASDGNDKITKVVIILDHTGTLVRVQVLSQSGLVDLDEAAVEAFRAAAPFPNPPKGIIEEDGTVKIRWDFVVEA